MATVNSTVTIDTGEWVYIDRFGIGHTVTNGQTFTLRIDDNSATDVRYYIPVGQSVTTTDGLRVTFRPQSNPSSGTGGNEARTVAPFTDAGQGADFYGLRGEIAIECPVSGTIQHWRPAKFNTSDADFGSAGTFTATMEDQFGNRMVMPAPAVGGSITVGQAS